MPGADQTVFRVKVQEVVIGFVVDGESRGTLGFKVLLEGDGQGFLWWLEPYAEDLGAEVLVTDDNDSYRIVAAGLGLEHQLCIAYVRK